MKKAIKIFLWLFFYPIFYWLDRHVVPIENVLWHSYMQDLVMPGFYLTQFGIICETVCAGFQESKSFMKAVIGAGILEFLFGLSWEIGQWTGKTQGTPDIWDVPCYGASIVVGASLCFVLRERQKKTP